MFFQNFLRYLILIPANCGVRKFMLRFAFAQMRQPFWVSHIDLIVNVLYVLDVIMNQVVESNGI